MKTITENFKIIVAEQERLGYKLPSILQPPATTEEIQEAELTLGFKFSDELKELYSFANGIQIDYTKPLGEVGITPTYIFNSLSEAIYSYNTASTYDNLFTVWETNYKPGVKMFPLLDNTSGDCYWVDLNDDSENYNRIFWTNTLPASPDYAFNSISTMFECIAECYTIGVISLDEMGYLNCDYDSWGRVCKKHNPGINFWDDYIKGI